MTLLHIEIRKRKCRTIANGSLYILEVCDTKGETMFCRPLNNMYATRAYDFQRCRDMTVR